MKNDSPPSSEFDLTRARGGTASMLISAWPSDLPFDARATLEGDPELLRHKSVVLDLAYEEFCQRREAGEDVSAVAFAERFPAVERSLLRLLAVDDFLHQNSELLTDITEVRWPKADSAFLNFELISELGKGAFSRVFLARETGLGNRLVVVKACIHGGHEAQVLGRLNSPHVVPVFSVQEDETTGLTAICMPYLSRATLFDVVEAVFIKKVPPRRSSVILGVVDGINRGAELTGTRFESSMALRHGSYCDGIADIGRQLAEGLAFAHLKEISHCDIKPSNVLMTPGGGAMLLDFNLAAQFSHNRPIVGGTLPYMAPEQLRALAAEREDDGSVAGPKTDLFQLGVTLFESLTGQLPFGPVPKDRTNKQIAEKLLDRQEQGPRSLRELNADVDARLAKIIERCLSFEPAARPASAGELAAQLREYLAPKRIVQRWGKRHRLMVAGVVLMTAIGVAAGLASREPYVTRQYKQGVAATTVGDFRRAISCFSNVLKVNPADVNALIASGNAYMKSGQPQFAFTDFQNAFSRSADGRVAACFAYAMCQVRAGNLEDAVHLFELAQQRGFDNAGVRNNIGWCHWRLKNFAEAGAAFKSSIAKDQILLAPLFNMALLDQENAAREGRSPDTQYVDRLVQLFPSRDVNSNAVLIYARAANQSPNLPEAERRKLRQRALDCCQQLVRQGAPRQLLVQIASSFPELAAAPRFQGLLATCKDGHVVEGRKSVGLLVDPLEHFAAKAN